MVLITREADGFLREVKGPLAISVVLKQRSCEIQALIGRHRYLESTYQEHACSGLVDHTAKDE